MNKTVLVTGASRGIGRAIAEYFGNNGYNVIVNYMNSKDAADSLVESINKVSRAVAVRCDVSDREDVKRMYLRAVQEFGKVDVIVNNAGVCSYSLADAIAPEDYTRLVSINLDGMHNVTQTFLPDMISRKYGCIVNISSIWGVKGGSLEVIYSMTKAGVIGYTKALAREVGRSNIRVNCVSPGVINTEMVSQLGESALAELREEIALDRIGDPVDIAKVVYFLASDGASYITGQNIVVDGGMI